MRIAILSIAFLFLAFSAQSQVLKSAGVWYFLDVDSMTARPAVLPNGTELAYVVGTKTVYYWNRNTSTWTAYGSTFNRDSIYFDASIIGSGTVSDPWGVDSTLFATIAAVGDSIAAAVANYFPLEGGTLTGTGGAGFIGLPSQVTAPGTPASGLNIFAQGSSFNWKGTDGFERQITSSLTGGRNYALPDINGTFALGTGTTDRSARWTGTNTLASGNFTDNGTKLQALLPFQLQQWTTAGRPTGVTGYEGYNTTGNGKEWYQGSRWAYALESTFARGTNTYIPYFDANGQIKQSNQLRFTNTNYTLAVGNTAYFAALSVDGSARFALNDGQGFRITNISSGNFYRLEGSNAETMAFNPNAGNFFGTGVSGSVLVWGSTKGSLGVTLGNVVTPYETILTNSIMAGSVANQQFVIHDNNKYPLIYAYNLSGSVSNLKLYGGYATGTNQNAGSLRFELSAPTGTGTGTTGDIVFRSGNIGVSGTTQHTLSDRWFIKGSTGYLSNVSSPSRTFHVSGEARITDLTTDTPTQIVGADSDGDLGGITVSTGLLLSGGNLTATGASTWLKTELEASRDVDITGGTSTDFRLRSNTRTQFDGKFKIGSDSTFVHDPAQDTTYAKGTVRIKSGSLILQNETGGAYMTIQAQGSGNKEAGILMESRGVFGNVLYINGESLSTFGLYNFDKVGGGGLNMSTGESPGFTGMASYGDFYVVDSTSTSAGINRRFTFDSRGTSIFHSYGTSATTAAALLKTLTNYGVGFATDGTVTSREIKRDTTIYVVDSDYDFSAALTTAQIASRYNRIIIHMTLTSGVGADKTTTLHTPDANLMQCEILIRGTDNTGTYDNEIAFGTNNAISSDGTNTSGYTLAQGQGLHVRVVYNGSAYKYIYY